MSRTRDQLEAYLKTLHLKDGFLLDVGGAQLPISKRLGSMKVQEYKIFDLPMPHETRKEPDFTGDINLSSACSRLELHKADIICCFELFEYVWNPVEAIRNIGYWIKPGGKLYISFPFIYPIHNPMTQDCLRYTEYGARRLLELARFRVDKVIYRKADQENIRGFYNTEGMKMAADYIHHDAVGFIFECTKI